MKKIFLILTILVYLGNLSAQEIELDDLHNFYNRINNGQLLPKDNHILQSLQQKYTEDTTIFKKSFYDKNGTNRLEIEVVNPCLELTSFEEAAEHDNWRDYFRVDGWINSVTVILDNEYFSDTLIYYNTGVTLTLTNLLEQNIALEKVLGTEAVIIPFSYCGTLDPDDIQITCIIMHDHKKHLYHFVLTPNGDKRTYKLDNPDAIFKDLPKNLQDVVVDYFSEQNQETDWY